MAEEMPRFGGYGNYDFAVPEDIRSDRSNNMRRKLFLLVIETLDENASLEDPPVQKYHIFFNKLEKKLKKLDLFKFVARSFEYVNALVFSRKMELKRETYMAPMTTNVMNTRFQLLRMIEASRDTTPFEDLAEPVDEQ